MKAQSLMTKSPACVTPDDSAQRVAQLMADNDCGCLPVVERRDNSRVIGVVTDRDIALRGVARGKGPDVPVRELMTTDVCCCGPDADLSEVERLMGDRQIRRIVVADGDGCCVGIISQADLARAAEEGRDVSDREVARVVECISEPARSPRAGSASRSASEQRL
ncbi:MAG TPA: CBS domain-containing protein [Gemmatimonadaceae bacterium]|nr:CBS domain-containing protein [Gemmatimonadaceae bacterium]